MGLWSSRVARMSLVLASLLGAVGLPGHLAAAPAASPSMADRALEVTNAERARAGLAPLALSQSLATAAQSYSERMAATGCFSHDCDGGMIERNEQAGYTGWAMLGENIAGGQPTPEDVVAAWMASPHHRANILNPTFTEVGLGVAAGGPYGVYWTQDFGAPRGSELAMLKLPFGDVTE